ncbi:MAG TPA: hypothetical protein VHD35_14555, partial [Chitinophagaceae bacterium]|nr:hypothetical protein [Chitinophagaceae bacterium]
SIDYYLKRGKDLIGQAPVDPTTGAQDNTLAYTFRGNVADMKGSGVELELKSRNFIGAVSWNINFQFNYATGKITKYDFQSLTAGLYVSSDGVINPVVGKPVFSIFSYKWAGLDPLTGDPQGYDTNKQPSKDYTSLMNVKPEDLEYNGPALPLIYGYLLNSVTYKQFSFSFNISYKMKYFFRRSSINYNALFNQWRGNQDFLKRWQKPGDEKITNVPSMPYPSNSSRDAFYAGSSALVEKGDHVRLQDISLSYDFTKQQLKKFSLQNLQLYLYANNLGIIWRANKSGLDPDYYGGGFPLPRTIAFGIKTNF